MKILIQAPSDLVATADTKDKEIKRHLAKIQKVNLSKVYRCTFNFINCYDEAGKQNVCGVGGSFACLCGLMAAETLPIQEKLVPKL